MKKVFILFATLLVSQVVIAGSVICGDSQAESISDISQTQRTLPPVYDPRRKIDPFQPIFNKEPTKHAARVHQTDCVSNPVLEGVDMSQLKLTGIVITERQPIALVQEADGKGQIITENMCYGRHGGKVERILNDRVIVREEILGSTGQHQVKKIELKLNGR